MEDIGILIMINKKSLNEKIPEIRNYLIIGDETSWKLALEHHLWGFKEKGVSFGSWNTSNVGDNIAFYVTSPTKKIIGFGKITKKIIDKKIIWIDEKIANKPIFSHRLKFEIISLIDDWEKGIPPPKNMMLNSGRKVLSSNIFEMLVKQSEKAWSSFTKIANKQGDLKNDK